MDDSFRQQIERARQMTGEDKVRESLQLFDRTRRMMLDGLRDEYPDATEEKLLDLLSERLAINRILGNRRVYG
jgi:hypothetical protein